MMKMKNIACTFILSVLIFAGCADKVPILRYNTPLKEALTYAKEFDTPLCVVLIDSTQRLSKEYISSLQGPYNPLLQKVTSSLPNSTLHPMLQVKCRETSLLPPMQLMSQCYTSTYWQP
jgi:hypothetical protein